MTESSKARRVPRDLFELLIAFLALHGAFNIGIRTEVTWTARIFAVVAGTVLVVALLGDRFTRSRE